MNSVYLSLMLVGILGGGALGSLALLVDLNNDYVARGKMRRLEAIIISVAPLIGAAGLAYIIITA